MHNIQIWTDGGIFRHNISVSIAMIYIDDKYILGFENIDTNDKDSDFAELFAIKKSLSRVYGRLAQNNMYDDDYIVQIYTDSLSSITCILSDDVACNPNNTRRMMILTEIRNLLNKMKGKIYFYHIKSHISNKKLKEYYSTYCAYNGVDIPFSEFYKIYKYNRECDNRVKNAYRKYIHKSKPNTI